MKDPVPTMLLEAIFPAILRYSVYVQALQAQTQIQLKGDKTENLALRVFTDADLIFQEGIARELLNVEKEKGWRVVFLPEEESPYNAQFPTKGRTKFGLDPIDGSLVYARGHKTYCHIASVFQDEKLEGVLTHTPIDGRTYCATRKGAELWTPKEGKIQKREYKIPLGNDIVISLDAPEAVERELRAEGVQVMLFGTNSMDERLEINSIFRGETGGFFKHHAAYVDWGPLGFIAERAGATVTDFKGEKVDHKYWKRNDGTPEGAIPGIIATTDQRLHEKILNAVARHYQP